jgi:hypothetical protein
MVGFETKKDCSGEDQQQFTGQTICARYSWEMAPDNI